MKTVSLIAGFVLVGILGFAVATQVLPRDVIETVKVVNSNRECPSVQAGECNPEIEYITVENTVVKEVPKKLTQAQIDGIAKLALKPIEFWTPQDHANWDAATNKAPKIVKGADRIVEKIVTFCPAQGSTNTNTNVNNNTNSDIRIDLSDRVGLKERLADLKDRLDLRDRLDLANRFKR